MAILTRGIGTRPSAAGAWVWALAAALALLPARAAEASMEYRVKAAFLYNFARFVEWPKQPEGSALVIGILGTDPLQEALLETVRGRSVNDRPIKVRRLTGVEGAAGCAILYVSASERSRWHEILEPLRYAAVLTVSDAPGFLATGGVMNLYLDESRVRFELNPVAARRARLKVSAQLMRLARIEVHEDAKGWK
jgi:hypothetical protein